MIVVLDASAAIELIMLRPKSKQIAEVLRQSDWVIAPSLFIYEVANALWKYHQVLRLNPKILKTKANQVIELIDEFIQAKDIYEEALRLSCKIKQPAYDSMYLTACRKRDAHLLSLDERLVESAAPLEVKIVDLDHSEGD